MRWETITFTFQQQRKLDLITIDHLRKSRKIDSRNFLRVIVVLARTHPGESVTSFVCQGFLEFLLGSHPIASLLRENFVFKVIPMVNPDGVFLGNNRCNLIGQDLNRVWNIATEFSHPTVFAVKNMLRELDSSDVSHIALLQMVEGKWIIIDSFPFADLSNRFCFGFTWPYHIEWIIYLREYIWRCLSIWTTFSFSQITFNKGTGLFDWKYDVQCWWPKKWFGSSILLWKTFGYNKRIHFGDINERLSIEGISNHCSIYRRWLSVEVDQRRLFKLPFNFHSFFFSDSRFGRNIARTLLEYYRFTNVLSIPMATELKSKKQRPKTHRSRSRIRRKHSPKPRPKSTRERAPISYNDLELQRDSSITSNEGSPTRSGFGSRANKNIYFDVNAAGDVVKNDQYSLLSIQASKFNNLEFSELQPTKSLKSQTEDKCISNKIKSDPFIISVPPKPSLTIIDFNQLTRGGLDEAKRSKSQKRTRNV